MPKETKAKAPKKEKKAKGMRDRTIGLDHWLGCYAVPN